jgi:hypothetical protein
VNGARHREGQLDKCAGRANSSSEFDGRELRDDLQAMIKAASG